MNLGEIGGGGPMNKVWQRAIEHINDQIEDMADKQCAYLVAGARKIISRIITEIWPTLANCEGANCRIYFSWSLGCGQARYNRDCALSPNWPQPYGDTCLDFSFFKDESDNQCLNCSR